MPPSRNTIQRIALLILCATLLGAGSACVQYDECNSTDLGCPEGLALLFLATRTVRPTDFADLEVWLDASSLSLNDSASVSAWSDSSGNGHDATAVVSPTYQSNVLNGEPTVRFDGTQYMDLTTFAQQPAATPHTIYMVFRTAGVLDETILTTMNAPATGRVQLSHTLGCSQEVISTVLSGVTLCYTTTTYVNDSWVVFALTWDTATASLYTNGTLLHSESVTATAGGGYWRLGSDKFASTFLNGDVAEFLVYSRALPDSERREIECYLHSKYELGTCSEPWIYL